MTDEDRQTLEAAKQFKCLMISIAKEFEAAKSGKSEIPEAASPRRLRNLLRIASSGVRQFMTALDERNLNAIWEELEESLKLANSRKSAPMFHIPSSKSLNPDLAISRLEIEAISAAVMHFAGKLSKAANEKWPKRIADALRKSGMRGQRGCLKEAAVRNWHTECCNRNHRASGTFRAALVHFENEAMTPEQALKFLQKRVVMKFGQPGTGVSH